MKKISFDILYWIIGIFLVISALVYVKESLVTSLAFFSLSLLILPITKTLFSFLKSSIKFIIGFLILMIAFWAIPENKEEEIIQNKIDIKPTEIITSIPTVNSELFLVTKIIDGDTLMIDINGKEQAVRLIGIDTPEVKDSRKTVQCFGTEASEEARQLMENKKVKLEADITQTDKDIYNRLLRYVYLEDGTLINKKLIEEGFGFEYTYKIPYKFQTEFKDAQKMAESKKVGLWADGVCLTPILTKVPTITKTQTTKKNQPIETTTTQDKTIKTNSNSGFVCDCSKSCTKISSCEEAYFQLNNCGCSVRDSDGDGVPCESLCN